jgi:ABC-type multidrug transport system ATPase subunit/pSer/pThr/pTyr-binding forkhead associated (FHA) protein/sulfur carrier protein ThiS
MSTNLCPNCGTDNAAQARFCSKCGQQIPSTPIHPSPQANNCPKCNSPLRPGARFCPTCGFSISQPAVPPRPAPPPQPPQPPQPTPSPQVATGGATRLLDDMSTEGDTLVIRWMGGQTEHYELSKTKINIGRAPSNDVVVNHPAVSGNHLRLDLTPSNFSVTDLASTNGTMLNGRQIPPNSPKSFSHGDVIRIGDLTGNSVSLLLRGAAGEEVRTLALGKLDLSGQSQVLIGRDTNSYLPLNHPTVSYRHAVISSQNGGLVIRDLGSTNGTFVNGQRISQVPLNSGDVIQIGPFKLTYDEHQQSLAPSMRLGHRIDALRLGREVGKKLMILDNIDMTIQPGEFVALVGGSGAGKSTLMKAMNGYAPANHGQMLLDGEPLYSRLDLYRTQMGYVPQDDIIHRELPVKLALWYAAKLRLPDARTSEIQVRIQDALRAVDMVEHADKRVRVLSGGQRKRVSIAVELLAQPTLFFLDEPTSGLDPGLEKKMMYDLNRLADEGRTVVLVTHATANIEQCDQVAFLSYGELAYYGPPNDALKFYDVHDFSDIYLKLSQVIDPKAGSQVPQELMPYYKQKHSGKIVAGSLWADHYRQSSYFQKFVTNRQQNLRADRQAIAAQAVAPRRRTKDSFIRQTWILARRQFDLIRMDWRTLFILLLMMPMIGILFMAVTAQQVWVPEYETVAAVDAALELELDGAAVESKADFIPTADAQTLIVMLGLALTQAGTFGAAYEIVKERAIFRRERAVNLSVIAYVMSKVIVLALFAIFQVASVLLVLAIKVDLDFPGIFFDQGAFELFITLYLAVIASIMFGLFLSSVVPSVDVVLYAILFQLFAQIILGGALFPIENEYARMATISYWVMDGMGSTVDLEGLNDLSRACSVVEIPSMTGGEPTEEVQCDTAAADLSLPYDHSEQHLVELWIGKIMHAGLWFVLTIIVQMRKKAD